MRKIAFTDFVSRANAKHSNKYEYPEQDFKGTKSPVRIICKDHGEFLQKGDNHLQGKGCSKCAHPSKRKTLAEFILQASETHSGYYTYSNVQYTTCKQKVSITCPSHGDFLQTPDDHLCGKGCAKCRASKASLRLKSDTSSFITKATMMHKDRYTYQNVNYMSAAAKVSITCTKHGDFSITPNNLLRGKGCPKCRYSKGETAIDSLLNEFQVDFEVQKTFSDCRHKKPLRFDFYIPSRNLLIEFDGRQHHNSIALFGGDSSLEYTQTLDEIKNNWASENQVDLLRIRYDQDIEAVLTQKIRPIYHQIKSELSAIFPVGEKFDIETDKFVLDIICFDRELDNAYLLERESQTTKKYIPLFQ
jgi:very-short-patch-repair endonuclease